MIIFLNHQYYRKSGLLKGEKEKKIFLPIIVSSILSLNDLMNSPTFSFQTSNLMFNLIYFDLSENLLSLGSERIAK